MSVHSTFTPRQTKKASPVSPENGLASVAHRLHGIHGPRLSCKSCTSSERERKGNYIKNVAGKRDGEDRYYRRWSCTTNNKFSCPTLGNAAYIDWAKSQLARDSFCSVVESVRADFPVESLEHHRLGLLLQEGPSPPGGELASPSLKRKAAPQATPSSTKRRLRFFTPRATPRSPTPVRRPSIDRSSDTRQSVSPTDAATSPDSTKTSASSEPKLVRSSPCDLVDRLTDLRAALDGIIDSHRRDCPGLHDSEDSQGPRDSQDGERTRENSLSPEEYIGLHEAKGLALRATLGPLAGRTPPTSIDRPPPSHTDLNLGAVLAAAFHSADPSGKKDLRARAKRENVVATFEGEVRRLGACAKGLA